MKNLTRLVSFIYNVNDDQKEEMYISLLKYHKTHGNSRLPSRHKIEGENLGKLVRNQRDRAGRLTKEQQATLGELGFF